MQDGRPGEITARFDERGVCTSSSNPIIVPVGARIEQLQAVVEKETVLAQLEYVLSGTPRTGKEVAVALCELDHVSTSEPVSDEVVRATGERARSALRHGDVVARWDTGHLLLLMRGIHHLRGAIRVANKVRVAVEQGGDSRTISVGVTMVIHGESSEAVVARATEALDDARATSTNFVASSPRI